MGALCGSALARDFGLSQPQAASHSKQPLTASSLSQQAASYSKGKTPVVVTSGQRQSLNVISAVNARGEFWAATYTGKLNAQAFVLFFQDFIKGRGGKVFLVVDGHPAHKAKTVKRYVASLAGGLELHFLPPYAPDLNPDELVWSHMKTNGVSKKPLKKNESLAGTSRGRHPADPS